MNEAIDLPAPKSLQGSLRKITETLAGELAEPSLFAPDWSPVEWRLARAVAAMHCVSPLLASSLRWEGPAEWRAFLLAQKAHVTARHGRILELLSHIDTRCRAQGVAAVALKGAALHAMGLYCAGERPMADVDLLVQPADTNAAAHALESLGFRESFANWKHKVFVPEVCDVHASIGEHADNYLKIELHTRIAEILPLRITDVTDAVYPRMPHPGLNAYPSKAALMTHLLIHAAGAMAYRALRLLHLHDIALVCAHMTAQDWDELTEPGAKTRRPWWALPPLQLTARYYPRAVPTAVLEAISEHCPWTLRQFVRHQSLSDVSLSYPWIEAFPGIGWSRSAAEILEYVRRRIAPDQETLRLRRLRVATDLAASEIQWCRLSQRQRLLRWMTSRPLRAETLYPVRMALAQASPVAAGLES
jgi:AcrR family transcriptional regulator